MILLLLFLQKQSLVSDEDFWCAFFFDFLWFFLYFLCTFFAFFASADRKSRYIRYRDNIGYPRYGQSYNIGDNQYTYSSKNLSYCPINRFLESVTSLTFEKQIRSPPARDPPSRGGGACTLDSSRDQASTADIEGAPRSPDYYRHILPSRSLIPSPYLV
jgi:hypothetical protein